MLDLRLARQADLDTRPGATTLVGLSLSLLASLALTAIFVVSIQAAGHAPAGDPALRTAKALARNAQIEMSARTAQVALAR